MGKKLTFMALLILFLFSHIVVAKKVAVFKELLKPNRIYLDQERQAMERYVQQHKAGPCWERRNNG